MAPMVLCNTYTRDGDKEIPMEYTPPELADVETQIKIYKRQEQIDKEAKLSLQQLQAKIFKESCAAFRRKDHLAYLQRYNLYWHPHTTPEEPEGLYTTAWKPRGARPLCLANYWAERLSLDLYTAMTKHPERSTHQQAA